MKYNLVVYIILLSASLIYSQEGLEGTWVSKNDRSIQFKFKGNQFNYTPSGDFLDENEFSFLYNQNKEEIILLENGLAFDTLMVENQSSHELTLNYIKTNKRFDLTRTEIVEIPLRTIFFKEDSLADDLLGVQVEEDKLELFLVENINLITNTKARRDEKMVLEKCEFLNFDYGTVLTLYFNQYGFEEKKELAILVFRVDDLVITGFDFGSKKLTSLHFIKSLERSKKNELEANLVGQWNAFDSKKKDPNYRNSKVNFNVDHSILIEDLNEQEFLGEWEFLEFENFTFLKLDLVNENEELNENFGLLNQIGTDALRMKTTFRYLRESTHRSLDVQFEKE